MSAELKEMLLQAPDTQLDHSMFPLIEQWSEPNPTALQVLEVLDKCVFSSLASRFTISLLQHLFDAALKTEGKTEAEVVQRATWRS